MHIERLKNAALNTLGKNADAVATSAPSTLSATGPAIQAQPLSGGRRAVSLGLFDETEIHAPSGSPNLAGIVAQKSSELSTSLMAAFDSLKISTADPIVLTMDSSGAIPTSGANKAQVEKLFKDNPELAKQFKDLAALNKLLALNVAMRQFTAAKKNATTDEEHKQAEATYISDSLAIQERGNTMTLADGQLTSAAVTYISGRYDNA